MSYCKCTHVCRSLGKQADFRDNFQSTGDFIDWTSEGLNKYLITSGRFLAEYKPKDRDLVRDGS